MQIQIGETIGNRYRVSQFLGRGGMAEVYKVWDTKRATTLALKLLHADLALDRVFIRRFQRAAQQLDQLRHPNIVRFYGLEQDDRLAFMLLDYVEGETLKEKIFDAAGPMAFRDISQVMRGVCSALQYAHTEGLVHCDIKPANIMIDASGKALVLDFGIARLTDEATATMVGAGTPAYMSPEQVKGLNPSPQTDIYGLGIVLFEMLTGGERPFIGEHANTTGTTNARVRWEQVNLDPPSPREYNPTLSTEIEAVIFKALDKDHKKRFQKPLDLFRALELALGDRKILSGNHRDDKPVKAQEMIGTQLESIQSDIIQRDSWWHRWGGWLGVAGLLISVIAVWLVWGRGVPIKPVSTPSPTQMDLVIVLPTLTDIPTKTISPTRAPTSTPIVTSTSEQVAGDPAASLGSPTFKDTFEDGDNFFLSDEDQSSYQIDDGQMILTAKKANGYESWTLSWGDLENFYLEITGKFGDDCGGKDRYGMIFRVPDPSQGYLISISCDGSSRLSLWDADAEEYTIIQKWTSSEHINSGPGAENRLGIKANGTKLTGYINGHQIFEKTDSKFNKGRFGVLVAATETAGFTSYLSQVVYWKLP